MDTSKKIKVFNQDPQTKHLILEKTLELCAKDRLEIEYSDFDEFNVSLHMIHWNTKSFFMIHSKSQDNPTFAALDTIPNGFVYTQGPRRCRNSGKLLYQLSTDFKALENAEADAEEDPFSKITEADL